MRVMCISTDGWKDAETDKLTQGPEFGEVYNVILSKNIELRMVDLTIQSHLFYMLKEFAGYWIAKDFIPVDEAEIEVEVSEKELVNA